MGQESLLICCFFLGSVVLTESLLLWRLISNKSANASKDDFKRTVDAQRVVMDSLGHGVVSFNSNLICAPVYSKTAVALFESEITGLNILDVIRARPEDRADLQEWGALLFDREIDFNSLESIAPRTMVNGNGRTIVMSFRRIFNADQTVERVVLIATDRTEEELAAKKLAEKSDYVSRIIQIAKNKSKFRQLCIFAHNLMIEAKVYAQGTGESKETLNEFKVNLHTLKGFSGFFRMNRMAHLIHELEAELDFHMKQKTDARLTILRGITRIRDYFREFIEEHDFIVGDLASDTLKTIEVSRQELVEFLTLNEADLGALRVPLVRVTMAESFNNALAFLQDYANDLSIKLEKPINGLEILGGEKKILVEHYQFIFDAFVHLVANSLDHGIQSPVERERLGKSKVGNLKFLIEESLDRKHWYIIYEDDGTGIDCEKVRAKWLEKKFQAAASWNKKQLLESILLPGFSTIHQVTIVSGLGVGLAVLKASIEKMGGQIQVDSELGKYTRFKMVIPQIWEFQSIHPGSADVSGFLKAS